MNTYTRSREVHREQQAAAMIEVAIPCYNEEITIAKVIADFRRVLPNATIVVYDNNSSDQTANTARANGARVIRVNRQGKGHVVQAMFEHTEADVLVMVDGDDTYEAADVHSLLDPVLQCEADMVIGTRLQASPDSFRRLHYSGNKLLTWTLNKLFNTQHRDILSGYRVFSRHFIDNIPVVTAGFEIETEMMIQACENAVVTREVPIRIRERPIGSVSKLNSFRDGYRIIVLMTALLRDHRPLFTFSLFALTSFAVGSVSWFFGYNQTPDGANVLRSGGAVLIMLSAGLFLIGLVLNTINTRFKELTSLVRRRRRL